MNCKKPIKFEITKAGKKIVNYQNANVILCPCGKCSNCRMQRFYFWNNRLKMELQTRLDKNEFCYFVTLTYNNENYNNVNLEYVNEFQKWIKRLRKNTKSKIKYFAAVELGIKSARLHYHVIIFSNLDIWPRQKAGHMLQGKYYYNVENSCWKNGFHSINRVESMQSEKAIGYVVKYVLKNPLKYFYSKNLGYEFINSHLLADQKRYVFNGFVYNKPNFKVFKTINEINENLSYNIKVYKSIINLGEKIKWTKLNKT